MRKLTNPEKYSLKMQTCEAVLRLVKENEFDNLKAAFIYCWKQWRKRHYLSGFHPSDLRKAYIHFKKFYSTCFFTCKDLTNA